jgi:hypothetical protein
VSVWEKEEQGKWLKKSIKNERKFKEYQQVNTSRLKSDLVKCEAHSCVSSVSYDMTCRQFDTIVAFFLIRLA